MIVTEFYKGQGLGNQLACYVATRVFALDKGYDFGIQHHELFKGSDFLSLDFGKTVVGGKGPQGGPPTELPQGIETYYAEKLLFHPTGANITEFDKGFLSLPDNTKIDGLLQDEQYIAHRKDEIKQWLTIKPEYECYDYADQNTCVINFRGGEYSRHPEFYLTKKYWADALEHMLKINKNFRFIVITDDVISAKKFFPDYGVFHFSIAKDYSIIKNAYYLILSNSSFAWFPAWLSENLIYCIAPKYWARHNVSDGYWSLSYNITKEWHYLDREGVLHQYSTCLAELKHYMTENREKFSSTQAKEVVRAKQSVVEIIKGNIPPAFKQIIKSVLNELRNVRTTISRPIDLFIQKRRERTWLSKIQLQEYRKTMKIYDAFNFFNELETLEIRLNILNEHVDYFVLVESTLTHSGKPKELFYEKNKQLFKKFEHKIFHYVIENPLKDFVDAKERLSNPLTTESEKLVLRSALTSNNIPLNDTNYLRDFYEKEMVKIALDVAGAKSNDFCYISDLDEIWNPAALIDYSKNDIYKYKQDAYTYYLNNRSNEDWSGWCGTIATKYSTIANNCLNDLRTAAKTRYTVIRNGGWHFTFQGGLNRIKEKLSAYSYHELNEELSSERIKTMVSKNKDIKGRYIKFWKDESQLPPYLLDNKEKYKNFFR